jgi:hypothetical protein
MKNALATSVAWIDLWPLIAVSVLIALVVALAQDEIYN